VSEQPTPRTDVEAFKLVGQPVQSSYWVPADFARQLERELAEADRDRAIVGENAIKETSVLRKERDQWREVAEVFLKTIKGCRVVTTGSSPLDHALATFNKLKEASK
jgi:hypothetical protein